MRTTIDIDERALAAARAKAASEGVSLGKAVSELVLQAESVFDVEGGFPVFSRVPGHTITSEMVEAHRDDE